MKQIETRHDQKIQAANNQREKDDITRSCPSARFTVSLMLICAASGEPREQLQADSAAEK